MGGLVGLAFPCHITDIVSLTLLQQGAVVGGLVGLAFPLWISVSAYAEGVTESYLNTIISNCINAIFVNASLVEPPVRPEDL